MTARDFNGSTDRLDWANVTDASATAHSFSCWINYDTLSPSRVIFAVHNSSDTGLSVWFQQPSFGTNSIQFVVATSGGFNFRLVQNVLTTGKQHLLVTWDGTISTSSIAIYRNGSSVGSGTTQADAGTLTAGNGSWSLGGRIYSDSVNTDGKMWFPGWWNRVLSADEIAALAAGYHPSFFENGLVWCPDLSSLYDPYSGLTGTADGTTTQDSVGPQILPCGPMVWTAAPAAAVGNPWYYYQHQLAG